MAVQETQGDREQEEADTQLTKKRMTDVKHFWYPIESTHKSGGYIR